MLNVGGVVELNWANEPVVNRMPKGNSKSFRIWFCLVGVKIGSYENKLLEFPNKTYFSQCGNFNDKRTDLFSEREKLLFLNYTHGSEFLNSLLDSFVSLHFSELG